MATASADEQVETFAIRKATRRAVPQLMAIWGPTFSGKTYGALLVAAGMVKPNEKVGFIDTENGRGSAFADDSAICKLLPQGYDVIEIDPPFHPKRYIAAIRQFEQEGYSLVITDSGSHAWSGEGGGLDMKEHDKGWQKAKLWSKRLVSAYCFSPIHHIVCLRAQEKVKVLDGGKTYVPLGVLPICEKSLPFDLGLCFSVDGEIDGKPATHLARPVKWPKVMEPIFGGWKPQLLTPEIGRLIREWNDTGTSGAVDDRIIKQSRSVAMEGMDAYKKFFAGITAAQRKFLGPYHAENKAIAEQVDRDEAIQEVDALPDAVELTIGSKLRCGGKIHEVFDDGDEGYRWRECVA